MKNIFKVWVILSCIILVMVGFTWLDTAISLKYEVIHPRAMGMKGEDLDDKEYLLNQLILVCKSSSGYLVINIMIIARWLFKNSLINENLERLDKF